MDYYETGTQGHPEPDIKSDGFHSFDKDGWIPIVESLPEMDVPVWLWWSDEDDMFIGCRTGYEGGWLWAICHYYHWNGDRWRSTHSYAHREDCKLTHWMPLPMPPEVKS